MEKEIKSIKSIIYEYEGPYIVYSTYKLDGEDKYLNFAISDLEIDDYTFLFEQHMINNDCYISNLKLINRRISDESANR